MNDQYREHEVRDRYNCQAEAEAANVKYYSYNPLLRHCLISPTCGEIEGYPPWDTYGTTGIVFYHYFSLGAFEINEYLIMFHNKSLPIAKPVIFFKIRILFSSKCGRLSADNWSRGSPRLKLLPNLLKS